MLLLDMELRSDSGPYGGGGFASKGGGFTTWFPWLTLVPEISPAVGFALACFIVSSYVGGGGYWRNISKNGLLEKAIVEGCSMSSIEEDRWPEVRGFLLSVL